MAKLAPQGPFRALDANGAPLAGGKLYTYEAGSLTPKTTYTTAAGDTANPNPIILNANGYAPNGLWLGDGAYKFVLKNAADAEQWTLDNVTGDSTNSFGNSTIAVASNLSVTTAYENALLTCTAACTLSLLPAADAGGGFVFCARNDSAGVVTIDPNGGETVNGAATLKILPGQSAIFICSGAVWYTLGFMGLSATRPVSADYSPVLGDRGRPILVDATAAAIAITPLSAVTAGDGFELIIKKTDATANAVTIDFSGAETGDGAATIVLGTQNDAVRLTSNGTNWISTSRRIFRDATGTGTDLLSGLNGQRLRGLTLANNGANDFDIAPGTAISDDGTTVMTLTATLTKQLGSAWAAGSGAGGLDTGAVGNNTYNVYVIHRPDTGVTEAVASLSTTAPVMPPNYTKKKYIGMLVRTGGSIKPFKQIGREFYWVDSVVDHDIPNPGITQQIRLLTVPVGRVVKASVSAGLYSGTSASIAGLLSALDQTDLAPQARSTAALTGRSNFHGCDVGTSWNFTPVEVYTNTAAQIRSRQDVSGAADRLGIITNGWTDPWI